jgi:hypothetical protein
MRYLPFAVGLMLLRLAQAQTPAESPENFAAALAAARAQWQRAAIGEYVYGFNKFCECHRETPPETLVEVIDGHITDVRHIMAKTGDTVPAAAANFDLYWTVDGLFGLLERAAGTEAVVRADFDEASGVPRRIFIDYLPDVVGDELDVRVTRFEAR